MEKSEVVSVLVSTMNLDYDAVQAYSRAMESIRTEGIIQHMRLYRADHERHIRDLADMIRVYGGEEVEPKRDIRGVFLEGMTAAQGQLGEKAAILACESGEKFVNNRYRSVLEYDLPEDAKELLSQNYEDEKRHLRYMQSLTSEWGISSSRLRNAVGIGALALAAVFVWRAYAHAR